MDKTTESQILIPQKEEIKVVIKKFELRKAPVQVEFLEE